MFLNYIFDFLLISDLSDAGVYELKKYMIKNQKKVLLKGTTVKDIEDIFYIIKDVSKFNPKK